MSDPRRAQIKENWERVRERIHRAEQAAGRPPGSVTLLAVSKKFPLADVQIAHELGQSDFGENYAQELRDKRALAAQVAPSLRWHFIGPLQSNKVKYVAGQVALVHSLDTPALLDETERRVAALPDTAVQPCLLQVNVAAEPQKRGVLPGELPGLLDRFADLPHLRCAGLMLIPPATEDPTAARPYFTALRRLRENLSQQPRVGVDLQILSMGMSHDLEEAIAEGATLVRVGTAIFGERR